MKRLIAVLLAVSCLTPAAAALTGGPQVDAAAALLMEKETGTILYEKNAHAKLEPASVTKVMTMLLIMEALEDGRITMEDKVTVSKHAASMGGSQVYLEEGEQMSTHEMLKAIAVASGNDASVAMAEHIAGSESGFVEMMNAKAAELGMNDSTFMNCTGLPAQGHVTSAYDIAIMSRALLHYPKIKEYTTIWMDSLRDGAFGLANTNKLIRFYEGATGLKTGSTDAALYCLAASAQREGMELIAVILKSPTSAVRFEGATALLNFGFANYAMMDVYPNEALPPVEVLLGTERYVQPEIARSSRILIDKADKGKVSTSIQLVDNVEAPVDQGQKLGTMTVTVDGKTRESIPIVAGEAVARLTAPGIFKRFVDILLMNR
ncbi:D-alanyl-D-alanine carboxypeptidase DacF [bioreactor metagenome]|uniref:serine-type D-Ala-D-Ala carboxypeptidase n=1 Tax=bioreactor metagenome TaxID=1076179 RepID=A0A644ZP20_9ZZZZ